MRLSTFSFDRLPSDHGIILVLMAFGLALLLVGATELTWRDLGARPSHSDSTARWSAARDIIQNSDHPRRTAIVGSSQILFAISIDVFAERYPSVAVSQLAVAATGPLATLRSLAESDFNGVVLFSFNPENLLPPRGKEQQNHVDYYQSEWRLDSRLNLRIRGYFESLLVSRQAYYGINRVVRTYLADGKLPSPLYLSIQDNRSHDADFTLTDGAKLQDNRIGALKARHDRLAQVIDRAWPDTLDSITNAVAAIHGRGGCVVFLRMPIDGRSRSQDQRTFSRETFWVSTLEEVGVLGIHYEQIPGVGEIPLPDDEHIDFRDKDRFTNALIDELDTLGIYDTARSCRPEP